jgi:hypothetical protein
MTTSTLPAPIACLCPGCGATVAADAIECVCGLPLFERDTLWTTTATTVGTEVLMVLIGLLLVGLGGALPLQAEGVAGIVGFGALSLLMLGFGGLFLWGAGQAVVEHVRGRATWQASVSRRGSRGSYVASATVVLQRRTIVSGDGKLEIIAPLDDVRDGLVLPHALIDQLAWLYAVEAIAVASRAQHTWSMTPARTHELVADLVVQRVDEAPVVPVAAVMAALGIGGTPVDASTLVDRSATVSVPTHDVDDVEAGARRVLLRVCGAAPVSEQGELLN